MARIGWRREEINFIVENYDKMTTEELHQALPNRSKKSINRKIEQLRDEGRVGHRDSATIKRAYRQRGRGQSEDFVDDGSIRKSGRRKGTLPVDEYTFEDV